jgi:hypothetical protein
MATEIQRREWVKAELAPGEKIIWVGYPDPAAFAAEHPAKPGDLLVFFGASVVWIIFLIAIMSLPNLRPLATGLTVFSSVLFTVAVTYFLCRHPFGAYARAQRVVYALTDRRGLIVQQRGNSEQRVRSFSAEDLSRVAWRERVSNANVNGLAEDTNDLVFSPASTGEDETVGFLAVPGSHNVERMIRSMLSQARA